MSDTVNLIGVKADGSSDFLGTVPMPASMKRTELAREQFGELAGDDMPNDADLCLYALEMYHEWLVKQGWGPALASQAKPAPVLLTDEEVQAVRLSWLHEGGISSESLIRMAESAVLRKNGWGE